MVYSRSRACVGPLTSTLSTAAILECTASWRSVLHALGVVTSFESSDSFRKQLIREREGAERGAFETVKLDDKIVTVQIDNFDILPFHSVKASGKVLPMVSGTATQRILRSRKRRRVQAAAEQDGTTFLALRQASIWIVPEQAFSNREQFAASFNSNRDRCILNEFYDIAFGIVFQKREELLDISANARTMRRGESNMPYKHQGISFRSLVLSCFKQHGGLEADDPTNFDQEVLFVDVSRMSAADILTIHDKIALLAQLLSPGNPGCPRHVIVSGDQPTYGMIVKIWRTSYLEARKRNDDTNVDNLRIHEWLVPFPGFFHIEKQSLYPLCKEILHGLGLEEMARCYGLSKSQIENILHHSHARNNRAVIFSICAALIIHTTDIVLTENPELKDNIESVKKHGDELATGGRAIPGKLESCTTDIVTSTTTAIGRLLREKVSTFFTK